MKFLYNLFDGRRGVRWLAARYPLAGNLPADAHTRQTVRIGKVRWRSCVTVGIGEEGLYLRVEPSGHCFPDVRIPWSEIQEVRSVILYGRRAFELICRDHDAPPIAMGWQHLEQLREYLPPAAPNIETPRAG